MLSIARSCLFLMLLATICSKAFGRLDENDSLSYKKYDSLCWVMINIKQLEKAKQLADYLYHLAEKNENEKWTNHTYYLYGCINWHKRKYEKALSDFSKYVHYQQIMGDSLNLAKGLYPIGTIYNTQGAYEKNLSIQFRIVKIFEALNKKSDLAATYNSIGNTYRKLGMYEDAIKMHEKSASLYNETGQEVRKAMAIQNLGNDYCSLKNFDLAINSYEKALTVIRASNNKNEEAYILTNLGYAFSELNQNEKAMKHYKSALLIWQELDMQIEMVEPLDNMGFIHLKLNQYNQAFIYFNKALEIALQNDLDAQAAELYRELAELYTLQDNFEKALHYSILYHTQKDSIINKESLAQINSLKAEYETEKKDQEIVLLSKEKEIQRQETEKQATLKKTFVIAFTFSLLLILLIIYIFRQRIKNASVLAEKNEELKDANFRKQFAELEMKALRAQINPHFLFNCLNSINKLIMERETESASRYLSKFSKLIRLILENSEKPVVSLQNELQLLRSYIELETLRFRDNFEYIINIDENIDEEYVFIPSMVLQPFIENAIWHGLMNKNQNEKGKIVVSVEETKGHIFCTITDNGIGREKASVLRDQSTVKTKSMGVKITEQRLQLLNNERLEQLVKITDLKDTYNMAHGTKVEINIPVIC